MGALGEGADRTHCGGRRGNPGPTIACAVASDPSRTVACCFRHTVTRDPSTLLCTGRIPWDVPVHLNSANELGQDAFITNHDL